MSEQRVHIVMEDVRCWCGKQHEMPTPTPARSEAAGGEEVDERDAKEIADYLLTVGHNRGPGPDDEPLLRAGRTINGLLRQIAVVEAKHSTLTTVAQATQESNASLRQQLAAAREDGERLDWLERHAIVIHLGRAVGYAQIGSDRASIDHARREAAIDAARSEPSGEVEKC